MASKNRHISPAADPSKIISLFLKLPLAFSHGLGYNTIRTFLSSSMAEHSAVNRRVVGSSPTWGAIKSFKCCKMLEGFFVFDLIEE